jgi:hypothetical protein
MYPRFVLNKALPLLLLAAVSVAACSSTSSAPVGHENPERAVVAWFDAVDAGDAVTASGAINPESLALILGIENDLDADVLAEYLDDGVPLDVQAAYWSSFSAGFTEFSNRPISTLTVGESEAFSSEDVEFASVPIRGGAGNESVVITRKTSNGTWQVDLVASLGDGFTRLLATEYDSLPASASGERIRLSYELVVVPSLWAAMTDGTFGDDFTRAALALIEEVGASE